MHTGLYFIYMDRPHDTHSYAYADCLHSALSEYTSEPAATPPVADGDGAATATSRELAPSLQLAPELGQTAELERQLEEEEDKTVTM
jgi:hypothetical protein